MKFVVSLVFLLVVCSHLTEAGKKRKKTERRKCGYDGCPRPKPDMINVHLVPHTHDDVGWLKTVDQYYYGSRTRTQKAGVQYILDSVVRELVQDPTKRFIYVESAFFFKWWDKQSDRIKNAVQRLVQEGRLEFIGGAWSMNDEATTHYTSVVDQFTWGLRKLNDTFGECGRPKIGWQIDPFGHSRELASLLAQMNYDGLFLGRIDYQDKLSRLMHRNMEMIWKASDSLGDKANLFTGVLYNTYSPPPGFCFDILCSDDPIIDDTNSPDYNVDRKVKDIFAYIHNISKSYQSNNVLITMGEDFHYQDALAWYKNLDKLIFHANQRQQSGSKINLFYSTPSCYLKALHDSNLTWSSKSDDFFPYASDPHAFWTGYFTSRPTLKRFERVGNNILQSCKQLTTVAPTKKSHFDANLSNLREAMGVMQHHDAVTGTEKQHVAEDYARLLQIGIDKCSENIQNSLNQLTIDSNYTDVFPEDRFDPKFKFDFASCADLNISSCDVTENSNKFVVTVYNPIAHSVHQNVRIPITDGEYEVMDYRSVPVVSQIISIPQSVLSLKFRHSDATRELVFTASNLPPVGYKSYFIQKKSNEEKATRTPEVKLVEDYVNDDMPATGVQSGPFSIGNRYLTLSFDDNGLLSSATSDGVDMKVKQNFYFYKGALGNNEEFVNRSSGAYIFRPNVTNAEIVINRADVRIIRGEVVEEVQQTFNGWITQVIRVYRDSQFAEFDWMVGEIPVEDGIGKEVITRFDTDIGSDGIFFTDSNGREMLKRKRNYRPTWDVELKEPVAGNYYPVTARIAVEDKTRRFAILTDRAQGGSSLADGSIELMVHRRLLHDDAFGVDEALNETAYGRGLIARGTHYFVLGPKVRNTYPSTEGTERFLQLQQLLPGLVLFSNASQFDYETWRNAYNHIYSALSLSLPKSVNLLTLEPWKENSLLIRFEHTLGKDEDETYSKPVTFDFQDVFRSFAIVSVRETTLAGNQWLSDAKRFQFTAKTAESNQIPKTVEPIARDNSHMLEQKPKPYPDISIAQYYQPTYRMGQRRLRELSDVNDFTITLKPMEIRTFVAELEWRPNVQPFRPPF